MALYYIIHIRALIVKIQEYTNKCTILKYRVFTVKTLGLPTFFDLLLMAILRECTATFVWNLSYK